MRTTTNLFYLACLIVVLLGWQNAIQYNKIQHVIDSITNNTREYPLAQNTPTPLKQLVAGAKAQINRTTTYHAAYQVLTYPNGDVPIKTGVCTDVVIRAFRNAGIDLQKAVHEDMLKNFNAYPKKWGLTATDTNIDHRRVPNLQTFFTRKGKSLRITVNSADYQPGDIVSWDLNGKGLAHVGVVSNIWSNKHNRYLIIHNIGQGAQSEDRLFDWEITGHYRYF